MKIIFICGSLEPGCDGVGDYSRRLAAAMIRQGNQAALISLRDKSVEIVTTGLQQSDSTNVSALRLPAVLAQPQALSQAADFIKAFQPNWVSLQYVPFAFHDKGLHKGLGQQLARLSNSCQWHIMFHELWLGRDRGTSFKTKLLSYLQQQQVKALARSLQPSLAHTHLPLYQTRLKRLGVTAMPLPLFSNISVSAKEEKESNRIFRLAFFSQVETSQDILHFINELIRQAIGHQYSPELVLIGGSEKKMQPLATFFQQACPQLTRVTITGFLTEPEISGVIANCQLGITPVPTHALGKSGSVAAFLAHGKPVAAPVVNTEYNNSDPGFFDQAETAAVLTAPSWIKYIAAKEAALSVAASIHIDAISKLFNTDLTGKTNKHT